MAEFCLKCFNKMFDENYTEKDVVITKYTTICEECQEIKSVVVEIKSKVKRTSNSSHSLKDTFSIYKRAIEKMRKERN